MTHQCQCDGPGRCPRFGKDMGPRHHQICSGVFPAGAKPLTDEQRLAYVRSWSLPAVGGSVALPSGGGAAAVKRAERPAGGGPGTELKKLIASLGLTPVSGCGWTN